MAEEPVNGEDGGWLSGFMAEKPAGDEDAGWLSGFEAVGGNLFGGVGDALGGVGDAIGYVVGADGGEAAAAAQGDAATVRASFVEQFDRELLFEVVVDDSVVKLGMMLSGLPPGYLEVTKAQPDSWAASVDLRPGDLLVAANGEDLGRMLPERFKELLRVRPLRLLFEGLPLEEEPPGAAAVSGASVRSFLSRRSEASRSVRSGASARSAALARRSVASAHQVARASGSGTAVEPAAADAATRPSTLPDDQTARARGSGSGDGTGQDFAAPRRSATSDGDSMTARDTASQRSEAPGDQTSSVRGGGDGDGDDQNFVTEGLGWLFGPSSEPDPGTVDGVQRDQRRSAASDGYDEAAIARGNGDGDGQDFVTEGIGWLFGPSSGPDPGTGDGQRRTQRRSAASSGFSIGPDLGPDGAQHRPHRDSAASDGFSNRPDLGTDDAQRRAQRRSAVSDGVSTGPDLGSDDARRRAQRRSAASDGLSIGPDLGTDGAQHRPHRDSAASDGFSGRPDLGTDGAHHRAQRRSAVSDGVSTGPDLGSDDARRRAQRRSAASDDLSMGPDLGTDGAQPRAQRHSATSDGLSSGPNLGTDGAQHRAQRHSEASSGSSAPAHGGGGGGAAASVSDSVLPDSRRMLDTSRGSSFGHSAAALENEVMVLTTELTAERAAARAAARRSTVTGEMSEEVIQLRQEVQAKDLALRAARNAHEAEEGHAGAGTAGSVYKLRADLVRERDAAEEYRSEVRELELRLSPELRKAKADLRDARLQPVGWVDRSKVRQELNEAEAQLQEQRLKATKPAVEALTKKAAMEEVEAKCARGLEAQLMAEVATLQAVRRGMKLEYDEEKLRKDAVAERERDVVLRAEKAAVRGLRRQKGELQVACEDPYALEMRAIMEQLPRSEEELEGVRQEIACLETAISDFFDGPVGAGPWELTMQRSALGRARRECESAQREEELALAESRECQAALRGCGLRELHGEISDLRFREQRADRNRREVEAQVMAEQIKTVAERNEVIAMRALLLEEGTSVGHATQRAFALERKAGESEEEVAYLLRLYDTRGKISDSRQGELWTEQQRASKLSAEVFSLRATLENQEQQNGRLTHNLLMTEQKCGTFEAECALQRSKAQRVESHINRLKQSGGYQVADFNISDAWAAEMQGKLLHQEASLARFEAFRKVDSQSHGREVVEVQKLRVQLADSMTEATQLQLQYHSEFGEVSALRGLLGEEREFRREMRNWEKHEMVQSKMLTQRLMLAEQQAARGSQQPSAALQAKQWLSDELQDAQLTTKERQELTSESAIAVRLRAELHAMKRTLAEERSLAVAQAQLRDAAKVTEATEMADMRTQLMNEEAAWRRLHDRFVQQSLMLPAPDAGPLAPQPGLPAHQLGPPALVQQVYMPTPNTLRDALNRERRLQQELFRLSAEFGSAKRHLRSEAGFGAAEQEELERLRDALRQHEVQAGERLQCEERQVAARVLRVALANEKTELERCQKEFMREHRAQVAEHNRQLVNLKYQHDMARASHMQQVTDMRGEATDTVRTTQHLEVEARCLSELVSSLRSEVARAESAARRAEAESAAARAAEAVAIRSALDEVRGEAGRSFAANRRADLAADRARQFERETATSVRAAEQSARALAAQQQSATLEEMLRPLRSGVVPGGDMALLAIEQSYGEAPSRGPRAPSPAGHSESPTLLSMSAQGLAARRLQRDASDSRSPLRGRVADMELPLRTTAAESRASSRRAAAGDAPTPLGAAERGDSVSSRGSDDAGVSYPTLDELRWQRRGRPFASGERTDVGDSAGDGGALLGRGPRTSAVPSFSAAQGAYAQASPTRPAHAAAAWTGLRPSTLDSQASVLLAQAEGLRNDVRQLRARASAAIASPRTPPSTSAFASVSFAAGEVGLPALAGPGAGGRRVGAGQVREDVAREGFG